VENGPGVPLAVRSQDIDTVLLDVGVNFDYQLQKRFSLAGRLGYIQDFSDSDENLSAIFAASGGYGQPFSVSAPGVDQQAFTLGIGLFYDINDSTRIGVTYRGEIPVDSNYAQTFGLGLSFGF
jgi:outer membrane autotransporter protein